MSLKKFFSDRVDIKRLLGWDCLREFNSMRGNLKVRRRQPANQSKSKESQTSENFSRRAGKTFDTQK